MPTNLLLWLIRHKLPVTCADPITCGWLPPSLCFEKSLCYCSLSAHYLTPCCRGPLAGDSPALDRRELKAGKSVGFLRADSDGPLPGPAGGRRPHRLRRWFSNFGTHESPRAPLTMQVPGSSKGTDAAGGGAGPCNLRCSQRRELGSTECSRSLFCFLQQSVVVLCKGSERELTFVECPLCALPFIFF